MLDRKASKQRINGYLREMIRQLRQTEADASIGSHMEEYLTLLRSEGMKEDADRIAQKLKTDPLFKSMYVNAIYQIFTTNILLHSDAIVYDGKEDCDPYVIIEELMELTYESDPDILNMRLNSLFSLAHNIRENVPTMRDEIKNRVDEALDVYRKYVEKKLAKSN